MWKTVLIVGAIVQYCSGQNVISRPQHPDEVLREVPEPTGAALARKAFRGLSTKEVIQEVYPTLGEAPDDSELETDDRVESLPQPEALRREDEPKSTSLALEPSSLGEGEEPEVGLVKREIEEPRVVSAVDGPSNSPVIVVKSARLIAPPEESQSGGGGGDDFVSLPPRNPRPGSSPAANVRVVPLNRPTGGAPTTTSAPLVGEGERLRVVDINVVPMLSVNNRPSASVDNGLDSVRAVFGARRRTPSFSFSSSSTPVTAALSSASSSSADEEEEASPLRRQTSSSVPRPNELQTNNAVDAVDGTSLPPVVVAAAAAVTPVRDAPTQLENEQRKVVDQNDLDKEDFYSVYQFGYEVRTPEGSHSHEEAKMKSGHVFGSYSLELADGRRRIVRYEADHEGFHPEVHTNELGTLTSEPGDARIFSTQTLDATDEVRSGNEPIPATPVTAVASAPPRVLRRSGTLRRSSRRIAVRNVSTGTDRVPAAAAPAEAPNATAAAVATGTPTISTSPDTLSSLATTSTSSSTPSVGVSSRRPLRKSRRSHPGRADMTPVV